MFTGADATLDLCAVGEKYEFYVEIVLNGKGELLGFKKNLANNLSKSWKIIVSADILEERSGKSVQLNKKEVISK